MNEDEILSFYLTGHLPFGELSSWIQNQFFKSQTPSIPTALSPSHQKSEPHFQRKSQDLKSEPVEAINTSNVKNLVEEVKTGMKIDVINYQRIQMESSSTFPIFLQELLR